MPHRRSLRRPRRLSGGERLESRRLLTAAPWVIGGDRNPQALDDVIVVEPHPTMPAWIQVTVNGAVVGARPAAGRGEIQIHGGLGDDQIRIEVPGLARRFVVYGGPGDDVIRGGAGADLLVGGAGDDRLDGGGGPDQLRGGAGHDVLLGGAGNDVLHGERGADVLVAAGGRDRLHGGGGQDRIFGAAADLRDRDPADVFAQSKRSNPVFQVHGAAELRRRLVGSDRTAGRPAALGRVTTTAGAGLAAGSLASLGGAAADHSGTNNQVAGVEEADIVKTDGRYVYAVIGRELLLIDAAPTNLAVLSRTPLPGSATGLFIGDGRVTVVSTRWLPPPATEPSEPDQPDQPDQPDSPLPDASPVLISLPRWTSADSRLGWSVPWYTSEVVVSVFDLSDPAAPTLVEETALEGSLLAARSIGESVYLVVENGDVLRTAAAGGPLPEFLTSAAVYAAAGGGDGGLVTVARLSPGDSRSGIDDAAVMVGMGGTIYAAADAVYVAGTSWDSASGPVTELTAFSLGEQIRHLASGSVAGFVRDQFAMDAADGTLRIATQSGWWGGAPSAVHVLGVQGQDFVTLGSVTGIAPGEDLKAARFIGDKAYLVTFLQVDPLFVIDLADPRNPRITGELKIPGFSSYLHPMEEGRLFGIGQGDSWGTSKLSLFNVADPASPTEVDAVSLGGPGSWTSSSAAWDHRAFSWFETYGLLAVPVTESQRNWVIDDPVDLPDGLVMVDDAFGDGGDGFSVADDGLVDDGLVDDGEDQELTFIGRLPIRISPPVTSHMVKVFAVDRDTGFTHAFDVQHDSPVLRSLRIGDLLYTVSSTGIAVHQLGGSYEEVARLAIGGDDPGTSWPWMPWIR